MTDEDSRKPAKQPQRDRLPRYARIHWWTIPRGEAEPQWIPAQVITDHDGRVTLICIQKVDGYYLTAVFRTDEKNIKPRFDEHPVDIILSKGVAQRLDEPKAFKRKATEQGRIKLGRYY